MNCKTCNSNDEPLIDGLCHRCTAAALSRSQAARNANADDRDKALNERDAAIATAENFRAQGNAFRSERDSAIAAAAQMREALVDCVPHIAHMNGGDGFIAYTKAKAARSLTAGTGWLPPLEAERLRAALRELTEAACAMDTSYGTGDFLPGNKSDGWSQPATEKAVGFAGGLGPDNLAEELQAIRRIARPGWWVDMEGKLRVEDWFSLELAGEVVAQFSSVNSELNKPSLHMTYQERPSKGGGHDDGRRP